MEGVVAATDGFAVSPPEQPVRREYTVRITKELRATLDGLANQYGLYTVEGTARDAEIVRVLLVCALTEGWPPRKQAAIALYVNGMMLISQGLWLGFYDVREDLVEALRLAIGPQEGIGGKASPGGSARSPACGRFHVKVDDWIRSQLAAAAAANNFVREDGTIQDAALVTALIQRAVERPEIYQHAFVAYARGIAQVRKGLMAGLVTIRDSLRAAVVATTAGGVG